MVLKETVSLKVMYQRMTGRIEENDIPASLPIF
jgi:hypothetical protein